MKNDAMKEGKGRVLRYGNKFWVYVPYAVAIDSAFPFQKGEQVLVKIVGDKIIIEKTKEKTK